MQYFQKLNQKTNIFSDILSDSIINSLDGFQLIRNSFYKKEIEKDFTIEIIKNYIKLIRKDVIDLYSYSDDNSFEFAYNQMVDKVKYLLSKYNDQNKKANVSISESNYNIYTIFRVDDPSKTFTNRRSDICRKVGNLDFNRGFDSFKKGGVVINGWGLDPSKTLKNYDPQKGKKYQLFHKHHQKLFADFKTLMDSTGIKRSDLRDLLDKKKSHVNGWSLNQSDANKLSFDDGRYFKF